MSNTHWNARALIKKYKNGTCSDEEKALVERWYEEWAKQTLDMDSLEMEEDLDEVLQQLRSVNKRALRRVRIRSFQRAAAVLLLGTSLFFLYQYKKSGSDRIQKPDSGSISLYTAPGGNRATLRLADGHTIDLNEQKEGIRLEGDQWTYNDGSLLVSSDAKIPHSTVAESYQLVTPKGGQYQITLPDGTHVWLNAASSLTYPTQFDKAERVVHLVGEAYFEVAKENTPFRVKTADQQIEVLGTHFNVNAYPDEDATTTTLLEGAVKISHDNAGQVSTTILKPGQQAVLRAHQVSVSSFNTQEVVSWKDGYFQFVNADLKTIMRQFSRWYNIEVRYEAERTGDEFMGQIPRSVTLDKALKILELGGVKFKQDGNVLTVMK